MDILHILVDNFNRKIYMVTMQILRKHLTHMSTMLKGLFTECDIFPVILAKSWRMLYVGQEMLTERSK